MAATVVGTVAVVAADPNALSASTPNNEQSPPGVRAYMAVHTFTRQLTIPFRVGTAPVDPSQRTSTTSGDQRLPADVAGAVFYSTSFGVAGTAYQGYVGLQANSLAMMSVWGATGCRRGGDPSSSCVNFDESGSGASVRISYPWHVNYKYEFVLTAGSGRWWNVDLRDDAAGRTTSLGSIQLPDGATGISPWASWIEWFHAPRNGHCTDSPNAEVTFWPLIGDGSVQARYFDTVAQTCKDYDVTAVHSDGSASIASYPQGKTNPASVPATQSRVVIRNGSQGSCLTMANPRHGARVTSAFCGATGTRFEAVTATADSFTLHPAGHPQLCMDLPYETTAAGELLVVGACTGHDSQRWYSSARAGLDPALVNVNSKLCVQQARSQDGVVAAMQTDCVRSLSQGWMLLSLLS